MDTQLITFDPVDVQPDHHAVVQLYGTTANSHRQPGDGLAVGASEAADGALADALTEHSDDFNLLGFREHIHGGPDQSTSRKVSPNGNSGPYAPDCVTVGYRGAQSRG